MHYRTPLWTLCRSSVKTVLHLRSRPPTHSRILRAVTGHSFPSERRNLVTKTHSTKQDGTVGHIGQPTPETHPHLMKPGEITPGITRDEYHERRLGLLSKLPDNSIVIVPGYGLRYSTNGIFYPFHQHTDLLYLCGINEPDCALVLERKQSLPRGYKMTLYVRPRDKSREIWDGPRAGFEGATGYFGADQAESINKLPEYIEGLVTASQGPIYTDLPLTNSPVGPLDDTHIRLGKNVQLHASEATPKDGSLTKVLRNISFGKGGRTARAPLEKLRPIISELRLLKSPAEIALMRKAGRIAGQAFVDMMAETKPNVGEHDLWAVAEYGVRRRGSMGLAYVPVVAGGPNALIVHYVVNNQILKNGTMVLVDAGAEYAGYASDITRTWPVNGKFTRQQRELYEAVLRVQKACIKRCTGNEAVTLDELQNETYEMLREELSVLFGRKISTKEMNALYPHHVGHYLGMDVHDTHNISRSRKLESGMVVTIEPGLYIPDSSSYPEGYRGIGIRIEDDIVIGSKESGWSPIILTVEAPKEIVEIEAVMAGVVGSSGKL